MNGERPTKVAIIGGGCAGMTTAFELSRPEHDGKYEVTVYQLGWRLGGKGASGRGRDDRIEEHGLHLWMGFYENAFRLMRECYAEAARDPQRCRFSDWRDAFVPDNFNAVADRSPRGAWLPWRVRFPPLPGLPGDLANEARPFTIADYLARTLMLLRTLLEAIRIGGGDREPSKPGEPFPTDPEAVADGISRLLRFGQLASFGSLVEGLRFMELAVAAFPRYPENLVLRLYELVSASAREQLEALIAKDDELRRLWDIAELTFATVRGALRFGLLNDPRGFDAVNDYDCREWLRLNGASERAVNSAFIRSLYDLTFAYEGGDVQKPRIGAGDALRGMVRAFFTYRGAFFWKMQSGMGDVVFAPLYEVLKRRGVRFEFFHKLTALELAEDDGERPHVAGLRFDVQAELRSGGEYRPLCDVRALPCWPAQPDFEQLVDGERLQREGWDFESHWDTRRCTEKLARVGEDFDLVVLAVGLGAIPHVARALVERDPRFLAMVEHVQSVPTQALQLWLTEDLSALGWHEGPVNISGFVEPFDTWADMSHLIREETHRLPVRSIAYFCSVLPDRAPDGDGDDPRARVDEVRRNAQRFLERDIHHLWPSTIANERFRWELLAADPELTGSARLDAQYVRANINPSDRYALSLPGSSRYRISPLDHSYDNLTLAGDWTDCGLNQGCVEAAVMSGLLAAHAISESPALETIVGFDHP